VLRLGSSDVISTFNAFPNEPTFHGGVRIATGYFDSSGQQEIAVVPGVGHVPIVKVFDRFGTLLYSFDPGYAANFNGGFNIAVGNIENLHAGSSEIDDIVTVPSRGVSDVRVFDKISTAPALYREFTAWGTRFLGGSSVAVADLNLDGRGDVIVGSGPGMAPTIDAFDVTSNAKSYVPFRVLTPFASGFQGGVNVSAVSAGAGVTSPLVVASQGISTTPTVQIFNGLTGATVNTSTPFSGSGSSAPVRTVEKLVNGHLFVFAAQQTNGKTTAIRQFDPSNPSAGYVDYILETDPNFLFGVFLG
jgi:trimeric autotransporter adhesin